MVPMLALLSAIALADPPGVIDPSAHPTFPEAVTGAVEVECAVEMISDLDGRIELREVSGCDPAFAKQVEDRLTWMTWKRPSPGEGPLEAGYAVLTGLAGAPGGLYVRMGVRFQRAAEGEGAVTIVPYEVVHPKKKPKKLELPAEAAAAVGKGCQLLLHVDEDGRTERVQSQTCTEGVREELELPLMAWTWDPLVVRGERRAFAVGYRVEP